MSQFPAIAAGTRVTAALLNQIIPLEVVKPTDETVTSSTTLQNDNDLFAAVAANATYDMECQVIFTGSTGPGDIKWQWAVPASASLLWQSLHNEGGGTGLGNSILINIASVTGFGAAQGPTTNAALWMRGTLVVSSTAGNLQLTWAQNSSSGTATTVRAQSFLKLKRTA